MKVVFGTVWMSCLFVFFTYAQQIPYVVSYHDTYHHLPQNTVLDIAVKNNQLVTVATTNGIVNFDGDTFYEFIKHQEYKKTIYRRIVWHPHNDTLYGFGNDGTYKRIFPTYESKHKFSAVFFGNSSLTYITDKGVITEANYELTKTTKTIATFVDNVQTLLCTTLAYYLATQTNIYRINKITGKRTNMWSGDFSVKRIKQNPYTQDVYFLSNNTLSIFSEKTQKIEQIAIQNGRYVSLEDIEFINEHEFFIACSQGVIYNDHGTMHHYYYNKQTSLPPLFCIYYHRAENCLLVGTENCGLMKLAPQRTTTFIHPHEHNTQSFVSIIQRGKNKEMFSAYNPGNIVCFDDHGQIDRYLSLPNAVASLSCINDKLHIGTWESGLLVYENGEFIQQISMPLLPSQAVRATFQDRSNNLWIATEKGVVKRNAQGEFHKINGPKHGVGIVYQLKNGVICLGGVEGAFLIHDNKVIAHLNEANGLMCREVRSFYEDDKQMLWIGTYNGGLFRYNPQNKELLSINQMPHCMLNESIFMIIKGKDGVLYMSSNQGIWAVYEKKLNDFADKKLPYLIPFAINKQTGMDNMELSGGFQNSGLYRSHETLFFPSLQGIVRLDQTIEPFRELTPVFTSLSVNDKQLSMDETSFEANTRSISVNFHAFSCLEQYNVFYQYRLVGKSLSTEWSRPQKEKNISMSLLPHGDYQLLLRAIDGFNDKFPKEVVFRFTILPRFYQTLSFRIFASIATLCLIAYLIQKRFVSIRREEQKRHEIEQTISELQIRNLQLQMNPHFIFNSLNNIIYLLNINNLGDAERMLVDFSVLLRRYLEKSTHSFLTIGEELEITRLYLEVQKRRFHDQFSYSIECPKHLLEKVIPSMLVQPFVENSIIHGFAHSDIPGKLLISVKQTDNYIQLNIEDNGIGRKHAEEINKQRKQHVSIGMDIVQQKINVIRQKYSRIIDLNIEDLTRGTLVTVKINEK